MMRYRAELFVRSAAPGGIADLQRRLCERLEGLAADGVLESVDCEVWGRNIPAEPGSEPSVWGKYDEFVEWAAEHDCSLGPAFSVRETGTLVSEETRRVVSVPMLCLAVYQGEELRAVYPCLNDGDVYTVEDGIAELEGEEGVVVFAEGTGRAPVRP